MSNDSIGPCWTLYTDGASCPTTKRAAVGFVIYKPLDEKPVTAVGKNIAYVTSHSAEFSAIIHGLKEAYKRGARVIEVRSDAQSMVNQLNGECKVNASHLKPFYEEAQKQIKQFSSVTITCIPRTENTIAHQLASSESKKPAAVAGTQKNVAPPQVEHERAIPTASQPATLPQQFWKPMGNELCVWNLAELWAIADKIPVETVSITDLNAYLDTLGWFGDEPLTLRRVAELSYQTASADAEKPLLLCDADLLDGRFRLAKALCNGKKEIALKRLKRLPKPVARYPLRYAP